MKIPTGKEREVVLNKLREAVALQIASWDAFEEISEAVDCSIPEAAHIVVAATMVADDGTALSDGDLDELLGIAFRRSTITGRSFGHQRDQQVN